MRDIESECRTSTWAPTLPKKVSNILDCHKTDANERIVKQTHGINQKIRAKGIPAKEEILGTVGKGHAAYAGRIVCSNNRGSSESREESKRRAGVSQQVLCSEVEQGSTPRAGDKICIEGTM